MIRMVLPREVVSGNALAYAHWRIRMRDRDAWARLIRSSGHPAVNSGDPVGRRHVRITAYRFRTLDDDNLSAGCKHLRDCLVRAALLVDDDRKWSAWTYDQRLRSHPENPTPGKSCTVVEITEATTTPETGKEHA